MFRKSEAHSLAMALRRVAIASASAVVLGAALLQSSIFRTVEAAPSPPAPCGTLDLRSQHCFPADGACCVSDKRK